MRIEANQESKVEEYDTTVYCSMMSDCWPTKMIVVSSSKQKAAKQ